MEKTFELVDKILIVLAISLFSTVLVIQLITTSEALSLYFNLAEGLEGEKIEESVLVQEAFGSYLWQEYICINPLTYYVTALPQAKILVNDSLAARLTQQDNKIYVARGDRITIDISAYSFDLSFQIISSDGIKVPGSILVKAKGQQSFLVE